MIELDWAVLTCPSCKSKESVRLEDRAQPSSFVCSNCGLTIQKSEHACCVYCEFSDLFCLPRQRTGTCAW